MSNKINVFKAVLFLVLGIGVRVASFYYLEAPYSSVVPVCTLVILTFIMQHIVEHDKPSFFNMAGTGQSFVSGTLSAFLLYVAPLYILWSAGELQTGRYMEADIIGLCTDILDKALYPTLLIFGYLFHVLWSRFSLYKAISICTVLYAAYFIYIRNIMSEEVFSRPGSFFVLMLNVAMLAFSISLIEFTYGDIISPLMCLLTMSLLECLISLFNIRLYGVVIDSCHGGLFVSPLVTLMLLIRILTLFIVIAYTRRRKTE